MTSITNSTAAATAMDTTEGEGLSSQCKYLSISTPSTILVPINPKYNDSILKLKELLEKSGYWKWLKAKIGECEGKPAIYFPEGTREFIFILNRIDSAFQKLLRNENGSACLLRRGEKMPSEMGLIELERSAK